MARKSSGNWEISVSSPTNLEVADIEHETMEYVEDRKDIKLV